MKLLSALALTTLCALLACAPSTQTTVQSEPPVTPRADGKQVRLAVLSFNGASGRDLSDSLNTALFRTGRFILLERDSISGLQSEASIGQNPTVFEGADVVVTGSITAFEPNAGGTTGGGLSISLPIIGGVQLSEKEAYIAADLRLVEVKTRRILNIVRVEGRSSSFSVGGFGGAFVGPVFIGGNLSTYKNQPMGKAIAVMLEAAVHDIARGIPEAYYIDPNAPVVANPSPVPVAVSTTSGITQPAQTLTTPKVLPGNALPLSDTFDSAGVGSAPPQATPDKYGLKPCQSISEREYSNVAAIGEVPDRNNVVQKALELGFQNYSSSSYCNTPHTPTLTTGRADWNNYRIGFDYTNQPGSYADSFDCLGIRLNLSENGLAYHQIWWCGDGKITASKVLGEAVINLASRDVGDTLKKVQWRKASIEVRSGEVKFFLEGKLILEFKDSDPRYAQGGVGFMRGGYGSRPSIFIDNLEIKTLK